MPEHKKSDRDRLITLEKVILGDPDTGEVGMKKQFDEIYEILIKAKGFGQILGGTRGFITFMIAMATLIGIFKGWFNGLK